MVEDGDPALLVSLFYYDGWAASKHRYAYRDWALDSGAYLIREHGLKLDVHTYIERVRSIREHDTTLAEVFALDVIGDWRASLKNTETMWAEGVEAIPCYHLADDHWDALSEMAHTYPKIAIGGMADARGNAKVEFANECFRRVWPKRIHGFAVGQRSLIEALPWDSVDASSWKQGALRFGRWSSMKGRVKLGPLGDAHGFVPDLRGEVEAHLLMEHRHRMLWAQVTQSVFGADYPGLQLRLVADWDNCAAHNRILERAIGKSRRQDD
jgi:hypothetical protein